MVFTVGLDFDGTVVENAFPAIGECVGAVSYLREAVRNGARIILFTVRSGDPLKEAAKWLEDRGVVLAGVNSVPGQFLWSPSPKPHCDVFVDDRGIGIPLKPTKTGRVVDWSIIGPELLRMVHVHQGPTSNPHRLLVEEKRGSWVFTDLSAGLRDEPFVMGADILMEQMSEGQNAFILEFQSAPFTDGEGHNSNMMKLAEPENPEGNWYEAADGFRAWLCPAMYKYFHAAPSEIYLRVVRWL